MEGALGIWDLEHGSAQSDRLQVRRGGGSQKEKGTECANSY